MPNPFAPRLRRVSEPGFPEARLRRVGATDAQVEQARVQWNELTPTERIEASNALAAITDAELAADVADWDDEDGEYQAVLEGLMEWAQQQVADGAYASDAEALDALDALASGEPEALTGVVAPEPDWSKPETAGGPTEANRQAYYAERMEAGLSPAEAAEDAWPGGEDAHPMVAPDASGGPSAPGEADPGAVGGAAPGEADEAGPDSQALAAEAEAQLTEPVWKVLDWIGQDHQRAHAVERIEGGPDGKGRKTILAYIEKLTVE